MFTAANTARTTAIAALTALSVAAIPSGPALAWGDREQGFLAGVVTTVIVDELLKQNRRAHQPRPAPVYGTPVYAPPVYAHPAPTSSIYGTPVARAFNSYSLSERKAIQNRLRLGGYYAGGIDGAFGPRTYNAVLAYARDAGASRNLTTTGGAFAIYDGLIF